MTKKCLCEHNSPYSLIVLALSIFFLAGSYETALADSVKDKALDDAKITTSVKWHLAKDDNLKTLTQISVKTDDKTAYLTGLRDSYWRLLAAL